VSYYKTIIIAEKSMGGTLAYKKFKLEQWLPNIFTGILPNVACKEKRKMRDCNLTYVTNEQAGKDRQCTSQ